MCRKHWDGCISKWKPRGTRSHKVCPNNRGGVYLLSSLMYLSYNPSRYPRARGMVVRLCFKKHRFTQHWLPATCFTTTMFANWGMMLSKASVLSLWYSPVWGWMVFVHSRWFMVGSVRAKVVSRLSATVLQIDPAVAGSWGMCSPDHRPETNTCLNEGYITIQGKFWQL